MQTTKRRLRRVGFYLLIAIIPGSMLPAVFASPRHTAMSAEESQSHEREMARWNFATALATGVLLGAGLALIITSFAIRPPREP